jgi:hypothetical protein
MSENKKIILYSEEISLIHDNREVILVKDIPKGPGFISGNKLGF